MTKDQVKTFCDNLDVAKAWVYDNKPIQVRKRNDDGSRWEDFVSQDLLSNMWEWRIKPEPREYWVHTIGLPDRNILTKDLACQRMCGPNCAPTCKPYKVREVME